MFLVCYAVYPSLSTSPDVREERFSTLFEALTFPMNMKFRCIGSWGHCDINICFEYFLDIDY